MAREPALPTRPPDAPGATPPADAPVRRGRRRGRWLRRALGALAAALMLLAAGVFALPRPGLPRGALTAGEPGVALGPAATRYKAGPVRRALLGDGRRQLWAAPIRVPVLDLRTHAGGLTPLRRGGGNQTRSLHLRGGDGRTYVFRSVDKDQGGRLNPLARATWGRVRQDQIGALHPAGALVADGLLEAAGVAHPRPRMFVMPDDPALGEHRADFAGLLGTVEENPGDGGGGVPELAGAGPVIGTDSLLAELRARPADSVDARAFLAARLMDVYLGDWDRHEGQWRWARMARGGAQRWVPLPRDRDYALVDYRGALPSLARLVDPKIVRFDAEYRDLAGLLVDARPLDARFLCPLSAATWDSASAALRRALTDSAVYSAVRRMPVEYVPLQGAELGRILRARRDNLPTAAREFRRHLHASGACG